MFVGEGDPAASSGPVASSSSSPGAASGSTPTSGPRAATAPLVRSLDCYEAYWDRWAQPWEFQALLKAEPVAGDAALGAAWAAAAARGACGSGRFNADDLRSAAGHEGAGRGRGARAGAWPTGR